MHRGLIAIIIVGVLGGGVFAATTAQATSASPRTDNAVAFGMDAASIHKQKSAGVAPDYGTIWVGPWMFKSGWGSFNSQIDQMRNAGVTPAIHFYYWGDDISKNCIENGCWSSLHQTHKNKAGWDRLAKEMTYHLNARMGGKPVVIFLETEFNKGDVQTYEALDGYLAQKAWMLRNGYKNAHINLALGNWNSGSWHTWDRAASASHSIGIQGMRGSTRDSLTAYHSLYEATLTGAKNAQRIFGKPIIIHDVALSTHWEPDYARHQTASLKEFFTGLPNLKAAGVKGILYRSWSDDPTMNLANYYGQAERHWGVTYSSGNYKSSAKVWIDGVRAERAGATYSGGSTGGSTGSTSTTFSVASSSNEWWADVTVKSGKTISKVDMKVNGGSYMGMSKSSWGTWTKSTYIAKGSSVVFRATATDGTVTTSGTYAWLGGGSTTTSPSTFSATFSPASSSNEWWADVTVKSTKTVSKVDMKVNGGSWTSMSKSSWGTWTKSTHIPKGSSVVFRATATDGAIATSGTFSWLGGSSTTGPSSFSASFSPASSSNEWWADVTVKSTKTVSKVDMKVNGGSWTSMSKSSWGTWTKSTHIAKGSSVVFRATATDGSTATSGTFSWLGSTSSFSATFNPASSSNEWWVDVSVKGTKTVSKVQVQVNGGSWTTLSKSDWGTWTTSTHVPKYSKVVFRATATDGSTATSGTFTWMK